MNSWLKDAITSLDAFPKVDVGYLNPTTSGGLASLAAFSLIGLLTCSELYRYVFRPPTSYSLEVDRELQSTIQLSFDISIATPCEQLVVAVVDAGGQKAILNHQVRAEPGIWRSTGREPMEGCRIQASIPLNKVTGTLVILPNAGMMMGPFGSLLILLDKRVNFSHRIHRFAFGPAGPQAGFKYYRNPLDDAAQPHLERQERFTYKLQVVPTRFIGGSGKLQLSTNQYGVVGSRSRKDDPNVVLPGLYFEYDLEPLAVSIQTERPAFLWFLISVLGIIGGIYTCSGMIHHCMHHLYVYYISSRNAFRQRYMGILDGRLPTGLTSKSLSYSAVRTVDDEPLLEDIK